MDNDDCFIQTIANYARQTGAEVITYRAGLSAEQIAEIMLASIARQPETAAAKKSGCGCGCAHGHAKHATS